MSPRLTEINNALTKLGELKKDPRYGSSLYAIEENAIFLNAIKSMPSYIKWLFTRARHIDGARLKELTDFPVEEWDVRMHERLIEIQKKDRPGLIKPIVEEVVAFVKTEKKSLVIADLGAGGMELDLQTAKHLLKENFNQKLIIVAMDISEVTKKMALKNLSEIKDTVEIVQTSVADKNYIESLKSNSQKNIIIVLCSNDIFELQKSFPEKYFDLIYHSLFKHHLEVTDSEKMDVIITSIAKAVIEYDGYKNMAIVPLQTLVGWNYPHFLNAELFSNLRFPTKNKIIQQAQIKGKLSFYPGLGNYLLVYKL